MSKNSVNNKKTMTIEEQNKLIDELLADEDTETSLITRFNVFEKLEIQKIFLKDLYRTSRDENHPSEVKNILA